MHTFVQLEGRGRLYPNPARYHIKSIAKTALNEAAPGDHEMSRGALFSTVVTAGLVWSLAPEPAHASSFWWQVMSQGCPGIGCTAGVDLDYHRQKAEQRENELGKASKRPDPPQRRSTGQTYPGDKYPLDQSPRRPEVAASPAD